MNNNKTRGDNFYDVFFSDNKIFNSRLSENPLPQIISPKVRTIIYIKTEQNGYNEEDITKIMAACKLSKEEYQIISTETPWKYLRDHKQIKEVILFGNHEKEIGLLVQLPQHYPFYFDQKLWIKTYELNQIMSNNQFKNELWHKALKIHFLQ